MTTQESSQTAPLSAIITGSSRGIGAATAKRLAADGYRVTVNCVEQRELAAGVVRDIEAAGGSAIWEQADVSDPAALRRLFDAHRAVFGAPDVVVANAGIQRLGAFSQMEDADFDRLMDVNVKGVFNTLREASRQVRDGGRIIALASGTTILRPPTYGAYAASKEAVQIYVNILAKELGGRQISVNAVSPGTTNTPLFTTGKKTEQIAFFAQTAAHRRLGEPEDIADVISTLCSPRSAWINGQIVNANGGLA
ncbi:SDR family oxidoreductase [Brucellaceae bacterium D45D]